MAVQSSRDIELTLVNYMINHPDVYLENTKKLKDFYKTLEYPYAQYSMELILECVEKYGMAPSQPEALRLARDYSSRKSLSQMQQDKFYDDLKLSYTLESTGYSGSVLTEYIFNKDKRELANAILNSSMDDYKLKKREIGIKLEGLSDMGERKESLGISLMSSSHITQALDMMTVSNTLSKVATGFPGYDARLLGGYRQGEVAMIMAGTGQAKAQPLSAKIMTPEGWKCMGEMQVGMEISNSMGSTSQVVGIFPQGLKDVYEITFNDGSKTRCCKDHLWRVNSARRFNEGKEWLVMAFEDLMADFYRPASHSKWMIPITQPIYYDNPKESYFISPYVLGLFLGNGGLSGHHRVSFSSYDTFIIDALRDGLPPELILKDRDRIPDNLNYTITTGLNLGLPNTNAYLNEFRRLGLQGHKTRGKFIPDEYKYGSVETRLAVLQGLLDTDGHCPSGKSSVDLVSASRKLTDDIRELVQSLGGICREQKVIHVKEVPYYKSHIKLPVGMLPFRLPRKAERYVGPTKYPVNRYMRKFELIGSEECQCIFVSADDHCYITDDFIVTHNTSVALNIGFFNAVQERKRVIYITMDNQIEEMAERFYARFLGQKIQGSFDREATELALQSKVLPGSEHNFILKKWPPQRKTAVDINNYLKTIKEELYNYDKEHGVEEKRCGHVDLLIVDYLEKLLPTRKFGGEMYRLELYQTVDELVVVADEHKFPVLLLSQANKESMKAETAQIWMSGESFAKLHPCAHVAILCSSDEDKQQAIPRIKLVSGKNRRPETNYVVHMYFDKWTQHIWEDPQRPVTALNSTINTNKEASSSVTRDEFEARELAATLASEREQMQASVARTDFSIHSNGKTTRFNEETGEEVTH
jgi:hypothetical protein